MIDDCLIVLNISLKYWGLNRESKMLSGQPFSSYRRRLDSSTWITTGALTSIHIYTHTPESAVLKHGTLRSLTA